MQRRTTLLTAALVLAGAGTASAQAAAASPAPSALERLSWLPGCWTGGAEDLVLEEQWLPLRAGTMVGMARTSRGGRTTGIELAVVRLHGDTLVYEARPMGQAGADFPAVAQTDTSVAFVNTANDFPQRIDYARVGADSLHASIEGPGRDGAKLVIGYGYRRTRCAGTDAGVGTGGAP
jgi:hypothetical protein